MTEWMVYFGSGFLAAALFVLAMVPLVHSRAVRLTERQFAEIRAGREEPLA